MKREKQGWGGAEKSSMRSSEDLKRLLPRGACKSLQVRQVEKSGGRILRGRNASSARQRLFALQEGRGNRQENSILQQYEEKHKVLRGEVGL